MVDVDAVVTGAGGFIGGHLVGELLALGKKVRAVDVKPLADWHQLHRGAMNLSADLALWQPAQAAVSGAETVYNLACDMGGAGYLAYNKAAAMCSVLISTHVLRAAQQAGVARYFFASTACVYSTVRQSDPNVVPLREADAYPAMPDDGYGWEKLFGERMCRHFSEDYELPTRVARLHNIYGPYGTWDGGREKAPAAICRKVAEAVVDCTDRIRIWGDGQQTRSFAYIDDCLHGIDLVTGGADPSPVNLGSDELVTINQLVDLVEEIADVRLHREYDLEAPQGVRGRNSDNTEMLRRYGWAPSTPLADGLERLYPWIYDQVKRARS